MNSQPSQRYAPWLWLLLGLFVLRVLAQPLALPVNTPLLPRFESWHSGVLPYPVLLLIQLIIVLWLARTSRAFTSGAVVPRAGIGMAAIAFGSVYFLAMVARLLLGATGTGRSAVVCQPAAHLLSSGTGRVSAVVRTLSLAVQ